MVDQDKSKQELIEELAELRRRVIALETALQENQSAAALLQVAPLGIHECDTKGRVTFVNPSQEAITGYTADELVGTDVWDRIEPGPERASLSAYLEHLVLEQPAPTPFFAKNIRKNGEVVDVRIDWNYKRNPQGQVTGFVSIVSDITERKRTEERLRESETRFRSLFQDSSVGTIVASPDGVFLQPNPAFCEFLGYSEHELLGKTIQSVTHPEDQDASSRAIYQAAHSGPRIQRLEKRYLHKSGRVLWGEVSSNLICDASGKPGYFITQVLDITERKQAEEALQKARDDLERRVAERTAELAKANGNLRQSHDELSESEAKYRHLVETTDTGYLILDEEGRVVDANAEYVRLTGHRGLGEIMGRRVDEWTASRDAERNAREVQNCLETGAVRQLEVDYLGPDGKVTPVEINASVIKTKQGRRIISLCWDITERKRIQEALQREYRNLRHLLRSSDHERQLIAYEIHDGFAQQLAGALMQLQAFDHLKDKTPEDAAKAYDAAMTMLRQGHFEARRLIAGVRPPILDEAGVVEAISHLLHEQGRDKGPKIEYRSRVDFDRLDVTLENAIYRIAQEGLANACKHSKSPRVRISLLQRDDRLRIEIRDWGVGFDPKTVPKNHFGLEGIRQRARLLGGKCSIKSNAGKGSRVTVELPVVLRDEDK